LLFGGKFAGYNGNENNIIDAQHNLHERKREQTDPGAGFGKNFEHVFLMMNE
jgi:hypothetical protein